MSLLFDVPDYKKIRVIIDTDAACEADDPFAIAHALMSPKLIVKGILAEHFNVEGSVKESYEEIKTILELMKIDVPYYMGEEGPMSNMNKSDWKISDAASFIINEANRDDDKPLFILCQGAITNVAVALKTCPEIADKMTIIWIGTHGAAPHVPPFREFNAGNDVEAANYVLSNTDNLWIVPSTVYSTITIGIAEIQRRIRPCGAIGKHLFDQMIEYNHSEGATWTMGESWSLGDSPAIALAINPGCGTYEYVPAPIIGDDTASLIGEHRNSIRMYTSVDSRYILEDLIAKLELFYLNN